MFFCGLTVSFTLRNFILFRNIAHLHRVGFDHQCCYKFSRFTFYERHKSFFLNSFVKIYCAIIDERFPLAVAQLST